MLRMLAHSQKHAKSEMEQRLLDCGQLTTEHLTILSLYAAEVLLDGALL